MKDSPDYVKFLANVCLKCKRKKCIGECADIRKARREFSQSSFISTNVKIDKRSKKN